MELGNSIDILSPQEERVAPLTKPLLVLLQIPDPRIFYVVDPNAPIDVDVGEVVRPPYEVSGPVLEKMADVVFQPTFITSQPFTQEQMSVLKKNGYSFDEARLFGPYIVYELNTLGEDSEKFVTFGNRRDALRKIAELANKSGIEYSVAEVDLDPKKPETEIRDVFKGLTRDERQAVKSYFREALQQHILTPLQDATIEDYPKTLLHGLHALQQHVIESSSEKFDPRAVFFQKYITPLIAYFDERLEQTKPRQMAGWKHVAAAGEGFSVEQLVSEAAEGAVVDFDFVRKSIEDGARQAIGKQREPNHTPVLLSLEKLQGAQSGETTLFFTHTHLVIHTAHGDMKYSLPRRDENGETAIKGGIARLVAKVVFNLPVEDELPPSDIDIIIFINGKSNGFSHDILKQEYGVNAPDIERIGRQGVSGYQQYLGSRDQSVNEVLLTPEGLLLSRNAIASLYQKASETVADPYRDIHGPHVLNLEMDYLQAGGYIDDSFYIGRTRFPAPRTLGRMFDLLIRGRAETLVIPRGSLKMDIGTHWLVMARKYMAMEDPVQRDLYLKRMVELANVVNSPYYTRLQDKNNPAEFIELLRSDYKNYTGRDFDLSGAKLSDKETLHWLADRLVNQLLKKLNRFVGDDEVRRFERRLTPEDMRPVLVLLPKPEDYSGLVYGIKEGEYIERPKGKTVVDWREAKEKQTESLYKAFSIKPPQDAVVVEDDIMNYLIAVLPIEQTQKGKPTLYYVPARDREAFTYVSERINALHEPLASGFYFAPTHIGFVIISNDRNISLNDSHRIFEEFFHSTGRHKVVGSDQYGVGFMSEKRTGVFFEEGLAALHWYDFCKIKDIAISNEMQSVSDVAGYALQLIAAKSENPRDFYQILIRARLGKEPDERAVREFITHHYNRAFYAFLTNMDLKDKKDIGFLFEQLGVDFTFTST